MRTGIDGSSERLAPGLRTKDLLKVAWRFGAIVIVVAVAVGVVMLLPPLIPPPHRLATAYRGRQEGPLGCSELCEAVTKMIGVSLRDRNRTCRVLFDAPVARPMR